MNRPAINQPSDLWLIDGSLRDVCVFNTTIGDWEALIALASAHPHRYTKDGADRPLPNALALFQDRKHSHLLSIQVGKASINCHFFVPEEIELDIDPREITGSEEHFAALQFIERLAEATRKDAVVTPENSPDITLLRYEQSRQHWHVYEQPANTDA